MLTVSTLLAQGILYDEYQGGSPLVSFVVAAFIVVCVVLWAGDKLIDWHYGRKHRYECRKCGRKVRPHPTYFHDAMNDRVCLPCWSFERGFTDEQGVMR